MTTSLPAGARGEDQWELLQQDSYKKKMKLFGGRLCPAAQVQLCQPFFREQSVYPGENVPRPAAYFSLPLYRAPGLFMTLAAILLGKTRDHPLDT